MAKDTSLSLRNKIIYQVFVRNYSKEGTFKALELDLDRIKDLGVDYIYLLPIHEIGQKERKGSMGSPYSIKDYYSITSDYGTEEDLKSLINSAHNKDMKIILDIVFHHTSKDSILLNEHPEWFYSKNGKICNRIEDWSDVSDLDFEKDKSLWEYLIDVLKYWAKIGVDGFRCDVSSLVPIEFWIYAREEISKIKEDFLWISESTHYGFIKYNRDRGYYACEEPKMYDAFDMSYDYDVEPLMARYLRNEDTLKPYIDGLINQEGNFPTNYIKMHNLENHDFDRIALYLANDHLRILNWHTFLYMLKDQL